jgi:hypothetical protein
LSKKIVIFINITPTSSIKSAHGPDNARRNRVLIAPAPPATSNNRPMAHPPAQHLRDSLRDHDSRLCGSGASMAIKNALHLGKKRTLATQQHLLCSYNWFVKNQYFQLFIARMTLPNPNDSQCAVSSGVSTAVQKRFNVFSETIFETSRRHLKNARGCENNLQAIDFKALIEPEVILPAVRSALARRLQYKLQAPTQKSAQLATHQEKT